MRRSRIELAKELVATQMNHWFYISIALTAMALFNCENPHILVCVALGYLPVYGYFVREKIKVFPAFMLLSVAPAIISFVIPVSDFAVKALLVVFSIFYGGYSIYLRTRTDDNWDVAVAPVVAFGVAGGLFILQDSQRDMSWDGYYILAALLYFAGYLIHYFLIRYLVFLTVNDSSAANIPEKAIFETGLRQTLVFTAGATVFLAMVANVDWLAKMLAAIKRAIVAFISKYLQITPERVSDPEEWMQPLEGGGGGFFEEPGEPALIWVILQYVATVLVLCGILIAVCYGIYKGYRGLLNGFHKERKVKEQELGASSDVYELVEITRKEREKGKSIFSAFTVSERIRRAYKKRVEKARMQIVGDGAVQELGYHTAKECCDILGMPGLKNAYEKARYSNANCTNEDLKASKG